MSTLIDISHWNNIIDWNLIKNNVDGIIIKCGGTDSSNGKPYTDAKFIEYYNRCKENNIPVGCYWFVGKNCNNTASGIDNALNFIERLKGKQFELPVFIDFETSTPSTKQGNTDAVISFCNTMESRGYFVGIYASDISGFQDRLDADKLKMWCWWVAKYSTQAPKHNYNLWQYTSSGVVSGISGRVDMSRDCNNYISKISKIIVERGFNGFDKPNTKSKIQVEIYTDDYEDILTFIGDTFADKLHYCLDMG